MNAHQGETRKGEKTKEDVGVEQLCLAHPMHAIPHLQRESEINYTSNN